MGFSGDCGGSSGLFRGHGGGSGGGYAGERRCCPEEPKATWAGRGEGGKRQTCLLRARAEEGPAYMSLTTAAERRAVTALVEEGTAAVLRLLVCLDRRRTIL